MWACDPARSRATGLRARVPQKVPCEFLHESHHLGWLDDDGDGDMLASGAKIELPVYLASELLRGNHVDVLTPQCFGPQTRNALKADPDVVNLRDKNEFFFAHGLRVAELTPDDEGLPKVLADAFEARYRRMLDTCLTGSDGDPGGLTHRLSSTESKRAQRGRASLACAACVARFPPVPRLRPRRPRCAARRRFTLRAAPRPPSARVSPRARSLSHRPRRPTGLPKVESGTGGANHCVRHDQACEEKATLCAAGPEQHPGVIARAWQPARIRDAGTVTVSTGSHSAPVLPFTFSQVLGAPCRGLVLSDSLTRRVSQPYPVASGQRKGDGMAGLPQAAAPQIDVDSIIDRLLEARGSRQGRLVELKEEEIRGLCLLSREIFLRQPMLLELEAPIKICGDTHGQYFDLLRLFEYGGFPPESNYLFLGDYVDRGKQSLETICLLLAYKIKYAENFFLLRGNHECASINRIYGFYDECKRRYNVKLWKTFTDCFNCLPVCAVVDEKIMCMHGGLSPDLHNLAEIQRIPRPTDIPDTGLLCDLLWSDPDKDVHGWGENDRGVSYTFGADVVSRFLQRHDLDLICRAHQVVEDGYEFFAKRQLVTIFSAPNYCGEFDNAGAMMSVDEALMCSFQVRAAKHGEARRLGARGRAAWRGDARARRVGGRACASTHRVGVAACCRLHSPARAQASADSRPAPHATPRATPARSRRADFKAGGEEGETVDALGRQPAAGAASWGCRARAHPASRCQEVRLAWRTPSSCALCVWGSHGAR